MNNLEEYFEKEVEFDFYGSTVKEVVAEVKCGLEDVVNAAFEDSKRKVINKFGSKNEKEFEEVKKSYFEAIDKHKNEMEELIMGAFSLPCSAKTFHNETELESNLDEEINHLQMRSASLDMYMKELIKADAELEAVVETDISELQSKLERIDVSVAHLSDNFHFADDLFSRTNQPFPEDKSSF